MWPGREGAEVRTKEMRPGWMGHRDTEVWWLGEPLGVKSSEEVSPVSLLPQGEGQTNKANHADVSSYSTHAWCVVVMLAGSSADGGVTARGSSLGPSWDPSSGRGR